MTKTMKQLSVALASVGIAASLVHPDTQKQSNDSNTSSVNSNESNIVHVSQKQNKD